MDCYLLEINESMNSNALSEYSDLLFDWVNDTEVRKNAFNSHKISYDEHIAWFNKMLKDNNVRQYILYNKSQPIGQIRFNISSDEALIDYSISPLFRGNGLGKCILDLAKKQVVDDVKFISKLIGLVKYENIASAKTFEKCGYSKTIKEKYIEYSLDV